jgi:hypothetical protein
MQLTLAIEPSLTHPRTYDSLNTLRDITTGCRSSSLLRILKHIDEVYKIFVRDYCIMAPGNDKLRSPSTAR